jgi:nucleoporin NDC1
MPTKAIASLKRRPVISYFFSELADFDKNIQLANCQCHLWAVQALSELVAASYEEDRYGIVQKDLCNIISSLLWLLEGVKQYTKQPTSTAHQEGFTLKFELRSALQQGLAHIAIRFKDHLKDLNLPPERLECFSQFLIDQ